MKKSTILFVIFALIRNCLFSQTIEYSEQFSQSQIYCPSSPQYDNWGTFRAQLDTSAYAFCKVIIKGSLDTVGRSCSDPVMVEEMAHALMTGTVGDWTCNSIDWHVGVSCGQGCSQIADRIEFNAIGSNCLCSQDGYILRPCIGNANWGGITGPSCNAGTQTLTVIFEYKALDLVTSSSSGDPCIDSCDGTATTNPSLGVPPYTYSWSTGDTTNTVSGLCDGTYTVVVTDSLGLVDSSVVVISSPALLSSDSTAVVEDSCSSCDGSGSVTISGGTPPYTYLWDANANNQTTATATGLCAKVYHITVTDSLGCTLVDTITITTLSIDSITYTNMVDTCNGTATVNVSGGTPAYSYLWDSNANNQTTQTATGLCAGTYSVTVTDSTSCETVDQVTILDATGIDQLLFNEHLQVFPNPSKGNYTIQIASNISAKFRYTVTDINGKIILGNSSAKPIFDIDISSSPEGVYQLQISCGQKNYRQRLIKQ